MKDYSTTTMTVEDLMSFTDNLNRLEISFEMDIFHGDECLYEDNGENQFYDFLKDNDVITVEHINHNNGTTLWFAAVI